MICYFWEHDVMLRNLGNAVSLYNDVVFNVSVPKVN